ncbi:MAG: hypothetical protein KIT34_10035 [Cyanobacteria bacterium TGS_CYA1]|nr:hypothetical protein [Cyanobacteria bacterium TGS_CYA1]
MPPIKELQEVSAKIINSNLSIREASLIFAGREHWPFNLYLEFLDEYAQLEHNNRRLEQDIYNQAYSVANTDVASICEEVENIQGLVRSYLDGKEEEALVATELASLCQLIRMYDVLNLISPMVDEYMDIYLPPESRPLFADSLLQEKDLQIVELIKFYKNDVDESCRIFVERCPVMLDL